MNNKPILIYFCVFLKSNYITLLAMLLNSLKLKVNLDKYDFLVITSKNFKNDIQKLSNIIKKPLKIYCFDDHEINFNFKPIHPPYVNSNMFRASAAKCRIFEIPEIEKYKTILYLDVDILIQNNFSAMFENLNDDVLYGVEDGTLDNEGNGGTLWLPNECKDVYKMPAINAGILLFNNTLKIKKIMTQCATVMFAREEYGLAMPHCLEQPFVNYFFHRENCLNSQYLKPYVTLQKNDVYNDSTALVHFFGPIGDPDTKLKKMRIYYKKIKYNN